MLISFVLKEKKDGTPLKLGFRGCRGVKQGREASVLNKHHQIAVIDIVKISNKKLERAAQRSTS